MLEIGLEQHISIPGRLSGDVSIIIRGTDHITWSPHSRDSVPESVRKTVLTELFRGNVGVERDC
jgi:hypothetical protein